MQLYVYGTLIPVYFKLSINGIGQNSLTLADDDVHLVIDGTLYSVDSGEIGTECTYVIGTNGLYKWQPVVVAQTEGKEIILDIKDADLGGLFDENMHKLLTGGDQFAYFGIIP